MGLKFREQMSFKVKLWIRPMIFIVLFVSLLAFLATMPYGIRVSYIPGLIFLLLFSLLTLVYIPIGVIVMIRNGDRSILPLKTLPLLAVLPLVREFAYVYGMCLGYYRGRERLIKPSWKEHVNDGDAEVAGKKQYG